MFQRRTLTAAVIIRNSGQLHHRSPFHSQRTTSDPIRPNTSSAVRTALIVAGASGAAAITCALAYDGYRHQFHHCGGVRRFLRSVRIAATISADYAWSLRGAGGEADPALLSAINQRSAERLLNGCLANGGLYVKIGQGIAAINHILPAEYTETLARLENECLPRGAEEVRRLFVAEFGGRTPEQMFARFDYEPVAAASLAQVFRARTHGGCEVAVKVQYADLAGRFAGDFGTIQWLQSLVRRLHSDYNFSWILDEVRANLEQEMDFEREGRNGERCAKEMRARFGETVHVPEVHWELTSGRVLTAEWCDGYKVTDAERMTADGLSVREVDGKLFDAFAEQIFGTGFVHADPHPGNAISDLSNFNEIVFVRKDENGKAQIVLLDHGLYENLPTEVRRSLCHFWEAIVLRDVDQMKKYAAELGVDDYDKLAEILLQRPLNLGAGSPSLSFRLTDAELAYMQQMAKQRFDTVLTTLRQMPKTMLFVVRNLNTIRAIARQHGDPLDRPAHMARYAQRCLYRDHREGGRLAAVRWLVRRVRFEYHLLRAVLVCWCVRTYVMLLSRFAGRAEQMARILNGSSVDERGMV